jgi:hypothetical protein
VTGLSTVKTHRCVTHGTEDHRRRPLILTVAILTHVMIVLIVSVRLLLGITVAVRVGCKLLLVTRVELLIVVSLKGLIRAFGKD